MTRKKKRPVKRNSHSEKDVKHMNVPEVDIPSASPEEVIVSYSRPSVERVREQSFSLVNKLEDAGCITDDEARIWKENLVSEFETR